MRASAGTKKSKYDKGVKAIMGSAAVVEGHHSRAKRVLADHRSSMDPLIFEAIMYLKMNRRLWGLAQVIEANKRRKKSVKESYRNLKEKEKETFAALRKWETAQMLAPQGQAERGDMGGDAAEL